MNQSGLILYTECYHKMLRYKNDLLYDKEKVLTKVTEEYLQGHMDAIDACLEILKSTHMILDMDNDF